MTHVDQPPLTLASRRGRLVLTLLCAVAFLDFVDGSIVNVALPSLRSDLGISLQSLQWVPSGYLLTYGGFLLLGGRAADLLGRRRFLIGGTGLFAAASLAGGVAQGAGVLIAARLLQGAGAALMLPAALSILTTTFEGPERYKALGVWGGMGGLGSAVGVLAGGLLTDGPGWRWVFFVNLPACLAIVVAAGRLLVDDGRRMGGARFDVAGAVLVTAGMLTLVFGIVRAPIDGWGAARSVAEIAVGLGLLAGFVVNERRQPEPLLPLSIFRVRGLAAANVTQLIAVAGFISMFFFITLYMQGVLEYSPLETGLAYLPVTVGVGLGAGISAKLVVQLGTRPALAGGAAVAAVGVYWLSRVPVDGSYLGDLLPALVIMALGLGVEFVAATTAANEGVPADRAGLAAALLNASQQLGAALGLAVFSAIATSHTRALLDGHASAPEALTGGFRRALLACAVSLAVAALIALRAPHVRAAEPPASEPSVPESAAL